MKDEHPVETLAKSFYSALKVDLPIVEYQTRDWRAFKQLSDEEKKKCSLDEPAKLERHRPTSYETEIYSMFLQMWGSTALGFGGLGGSAMTSAYTVIVMFQRNIFSVYWSGRYAYTVDRNKSTEEQMDSFLKDISKRTTVDLRQAPEKYGAIIANNE